MVDATKEQGAWNDELHSKLVYSAPRKKDKINKENKEVEPARSMSFSPSNFYMAASKVSGNKPELEDYK